MTQTRTDDPAQERKQEGRVRIGERNRGRIVAVTATITLLAAVWFLAARWGWKTTVPDVELPHLRPSDYFRASALQRSADYSRVAEVLWALSQLIGLAVIAAVALRARTLAPRIGIGRIGTGIVLGALVATASAFAALPLGLLSTWWDRRNGLTKHGYARVVAGVWTTAIGETLLLALLGVVVIGFAAWLGRLWWVGAGIVLVAVMAVVSFAAPYVLVLGTKPLQRAALRDDVRELERATGTLGTPVRVETVSDTTRQANAFSVGFGPSRRVVLWDTILRFPRREVRVVTAHELGHVARGHVLKGVLWFALFVLPLLALLAELMRRRGGLADPSRFPLALLVAALLALAVTPAANVVSRRYEAEADWIALRTTRDPSGARRLFERFATSSLAQPNPPTWVYLMLEDHPTLMQRIAMVRAWAARGSRNPMRAARVSRAGS
jgi:STE24 endopeptidase